MRFRTLFTAFLTVFALIGMACNGDDEDVTADADAEIDVGDETTTTTAAGDAGETTTTAAGEAGETLTANLNALNDSGASGTARVELLPDGQVRVRLETQGVSANVPHAQHIHIGGRHECPDAALSGDDKFITTAEGAPAYGPAEVSLTTEGGVGEDSVLAVERFPKDEDDSYTYERTFALPEGVTEADVKQGVIVVHGIAKLFGDESAYDGDMRSSLDPNLPLEATIPAACGKLGGT